MAQISIVKGGYSQSVALGVYDTALEAAHAFDKRARELGRHESCNFPLGGGGAAGGAMKRSAARAAPASPAKQPRMLPPLPLLVRLQSAPADAPLPALRLLLAEADARHTELQETLAAIAAEDAREVAAAARLRTSLRAAEEAEALRLQREERETLRASSAAATALAREATLAAAAAAARAQEAAAAAAAAAEEDSDDEGQGGAVTCEA